MLSKRGQFHASYRRLHLAATCVIASLLTLLLLSSMNIKPVGADATAVTGTLSGTVFNDINADGAHNGSEGGVADVQVTAYDVSGTVAGSAASIADGSWSIAATGSGPYRVEFSAIPTGMTHGPVGADSGSSVQFVSGASASDIDFGVHFASEYCQSNPHLATSCYVNGDPLLGGDAGSADSMVAFNYDDSGAGIAPDHVALASEIGSSWGLAWQRSSSSLFTTAVMKRHSGFGPARHWWSLSH